MGKMATKTAGIQRQAELTASLLRRNTSWYSLKRWRLRQKANNYICISFFIKSTVQIKEYLLTLRTCPFFGVIMALSLCFLKSS